MGVAVVLALAIDAFLRLAQVAEDPRVAGQAFNVGTGAPVSELEMTEQILAVMGRHDLAGGARRAKAVASETLAGVRKAAGLGV